MRDTIDWSKAPEGATHINQFGGRWIKHLGNGQHQFWDGAEWEMGSGCMDNRYIKRPEPDAWAGEGLPPVGAVCEHKRVHEWQKVEVFAVKPNYNGSHTALFTYENGCWAGCAEPSFFRPVRTSEQIAAEERGGEIDALCSDIVSHYEAPKMSEHYQGLATALHKAGYRKVAQ